MHTRKIRCAKHTVGSTSASLCLTFLIRLNRVIDQTKLSIFPNDEFIQSSVCVTTHKFLRTLYKSHSFLRFLFQIYFSFNVIVLIANCLICFLILHNFSLLALKSLGLCIALLAWLFFALRNCVPCVPKASLRHKPLRKVVCVHICVTICATILQELLSAYIAKSDFPNN